MRCVFCHNYGLAANPTLEPAINEEDFFNFLSKRQNILQGVCISGGEPTLATDLIDFILRIKSMNLKVKLDTNGLRPDILHKLLSEHLIDKVAMDIKASPEHYPVVCGIPGLDIAPILESVQMLLTDPCNTDYEFRTTVCGNLHTAEDFLAIGPWLVGAKAYYLQNFTRSDKVPATYIYEASHDELEAYRALLLPYIPNTYIR